MAIEAKDGWDLVLRARRWHYFRDGQSLCEYWWKYFETPLKAKDRAKARKICVKCYEKLWENQ